MKKYLLIISILFLTNFSYAQTGTFSIGYSIGVATKGGISFGYSLSDKIIIEFHFNAMPHMFANGIALRIYPITENYNSYLILGYSYFGSYRFSLDQDSLDYKFLSKEKKFKGFNFGIGNEFNFKQRNLKLPVELGMNFIFDSETFTNLQMTKKTNTELITEYKTIKKTQKELDMNWSGFFLVGINSYFKLKSEKVKR